MELERNAEFISNLSGVQYIAGLPKLPQLIDLPEQLRVTGEYFIIVPGASWHGKQWPPELFAQVLEHLNKRYGLQPILCGSPAEQTICRIVADKANVSALNFAGRTHLPELVELLRHAQLLIANDTSGVHIATEVGTPSVCILGGGHYGRFMPYPETIQGIKPIVAVNCMECFDCNWRCNAVYDQSGSVPCISGVSLEQVIAGGEQVLSFKGLLDYLTFDITLKLVRMV